MSSNTSSLLEAYTAAANGSVVIPGVNSPTSTSPKDDQQETNQDGSMKEEANLPRAESDAHEQTSASDSNTNPMTPRDESKSSSSISSSSPSITATTAHSQAAPTEDPTTIAVEAMGLPSATELDPAELPSSSPSANLIDTESATDSSSFPPSSSFSAPSQSPQNSTTQTQSLSPTSLGPEHHRRDSSINLIPTAEPSSLTGTAIAGGDASSSAPISSTAQSSSTSTSTSTSAPPSSSLRGIPPGLKVLVNFRATGSAPIMKKTKFTLNASHRFGMIIEWLRKTLHFKPQDSLFVFCNAAFSPNPDSSMYDLFQCFAIQGELVINYAIQDAWG